MSGRHIHLIGICGTAMATLAALLKQRGDQIRGSDLHVYPPMSDFLAAEGIPVLQGYDAAHLDPHCELVVVGNAISRGNAELEVVLDRRLRHVSLPEMLRDTFLWDAKPVVVAGTHGKTTTTALAGWLLTAAGLDPTVFVGGIARNFGSEGSSYRLGSRTAPFVIEGDEYDSAFFDKTAKFLKYLPDIAVVNNIEFDHADIYADLDAVRLAFKRLVNLVPRGGLTVLGSDSADAAALAPLARSRVETFGTGPGPDAARGASSAAAHWRAVGIESRDGHTAFTLEYRGPSLPRQSAECTLQVPLLGDHNVRNTLAAIVVARAHGVTLAAIRDALPAFRGVKRRLDEVGTVREITVYDDFAHHPTAVAETLRAVRAAYPGRRVWAVFEPRSASSARRVFQDDFARAFALADHVVLASVAKTNVPERERLAEAQLVKDLTAAGSGAVHLPDVDSIVSHVAAHALPGDVVIVMSNGGFGGIHGKLLQAIGDSSR